MTELIALWGVRVGSVEGAGTIRHSFAFDLREVDLRGRPIVAAALELPASVARAVRAIRLSDPAREVPYGSARHAWGAEVTSVTLSPAAIADLQGAAGAFFSVDAEFEDDPSLPLCLGGTSEKRLALFAVVARATAVAAASPSLVADAANAA